MGLIKAAIGAVGGTLADTWIDYFAMDALPPDVLIAKGQRYTGGRGSNKKGSDNVITQGSGIVVAEGQAVAVVDGGRIVEFTAEPGDFTFDKNGEPSLFAGNGLAEDLGNVFAIMLERFTYGGSAAKDQRVYYFNIKEIVGNKYGTPNPVPFRAVDTNIGLDVDIEIKCHGEFSYKLVNPLLFYKNVAGNIDDVFTRGEIESQLKTELLTALGPALAKISALGVRYSAVVAHTQEIADALNEQLSSKWGELRGIEIVSFGIASLTASEEDEQMIKDLQKSAVFKDPSMAAANLAGAQADALRSAAANEAGSMVGFMGLGMAQQAGGTSVGELFEVASKHAEAQGGSVAPGAGAAAPAASEARPAPEAAWTCARCGHAGNKGKFCEQCGAPRPETGDAWTCAKCGHAGNKGNFCEECGAPK